MDSMKEMCILRKPYCCKKCGQDTLYFITSNRMLISYSDLMKNASMLSDVKKRLYYRQVKYLKCLNCNKEFIIDWRRGYPIQLLDREALKEFGV